MNEFSAGRKYLIAQIITAEASLGEAAGDDRKQQLSNMTFSCLLQDELTKANRLLIERMLKDPAGKRCGPLC